MEELRQSDRVIASRWIVCGGDEDGVGDGNNEAGKNVTAANHNARPRLLGFRGLLLQQMINYDQSKQFSLLRYLRLKSVISGQRYA